MAAPPLDYDVVIVGCGPVGAFASLLLARYGVSVLVVEAEESAYGVPRAIALDDEVIRLLGLISAELAALMDEHVYRAPIEVRSGTYPPRYGDQRAPPGEIRGWSIVGPAPAIIGGTCRAYASCCSYSAPAYPS